MKFPRIHLPRNLYRPIPAQTALNLVLGSALLATLAFVFLFLRPAPPKPVSRVVSNVMAALNQPPSHRLDIYGPPDAPMNSPLGVDIDADGRIYVADTGNAQIQVFRIEGGQGRPVGRFGGFGHGPGQFDYPMDVLVRQGKLYVADMKNSRVQIFSLDGKYEGVIPDPQRHGGLRLGPTALGKDEENRLYVSTLNHEILVFDQKDQLVGKIGAAGELDGELSYPYGVARDIRGNLWVADTNNGRVQVFDPQGRYRFKLGGMAMPRGVAIDKHGRVFVVDVLQHTVFALASNGTSLFQFGERGLDEGQFNFPNDIAIQDDLIYITDRENNRISVWGY